MLLLDRRNQQEIMIGDNITIKIVRIIGGQVRVGIDAPRDTPVHRKEIYLLNKANKKMNTNTNKVEEEANGNR